MIRDNSYVVVPKKHQHSLYAVTGFTRVLVRVHEIIYKEKAFATRQHRRTITPASPIRDKVVMRGKSERHDGEADERNLTCERVVVGTYAISNLHKRHREVVSQNYGRDTRVRIIRDNLSIVNVLQALALTAIIEG